MSNQKKKGFVYKTGVLLFILNAGIGIVNGDDDITFRTGFAPISVAVGDLNKDGKEDPAVANEWDNTVSILINITNRNTGDINQDGEVNISDVILCLRMAIDLSITINGIEYQSPYTPELIGIADMDNYNQITILSDVILILRKAIGLP